MMKEKILITVKTYPAPSKTYDELVCTAGLREDGSWIRLYPVPFRKMAYRQQYKKYDWIEVEVKRKKGDFRKESCSPNSEIEIVGHLGTENCWEERRKLVLEKTKIYTNLTTLIRDSKSPLFTSLAVFKPSTVLGFTFEPTEEDWDRETSERLRQGNLFDPDDFKPVKKLPFIFKYKFKDDEGKESHLMIEDWEVGELYWKYAEKGKELACEKVKEKFFVKFIAEKDLYFFLGTTKRRHNTAKNPFIIIGVFYPPKTKQLSLF